MTKKQKYFLNTPQKHASFLKRLPCVQCDKKANYAKHGVPCCEGCQVDDNEATKRLAKSLTFFSGDIYTACMILIKVKEGL